MGWLRMWVKVVSLNSMAYLLSCENFKMSDETLVAYVILRTGFSTLAVCANSQDVSCLIIL